MNNKSKVERVVKNECLLIGLQNEFIEHGVRYAKRYFEHSKCFHTSVKHGLELAEDLGRVNCL